MITDPILTLAWLTLSHLVADFLLQTGEIASAKAASGERAWRGLLAHGLGVAICLVPVVLAFGLQGLWALVAITLAHLAIDRAKTVATRRAEARAVGGARRRHEGAAPAAGLGRAWTPLPAAYFVLDQIAHLAVLALAWAIWLAGRSPTADWSAAFERLTRGVDPATIHEVALTGVVIVAVVIANVRGGAFFVATLVRPLEAATGTDDDEPPATGADVATGRVPKKAGGAMGKAKVERRRGWSFRIGPLAGRVVADPPQPESAADGVRERLAIPPPARVGATIGVLERLLIVMFVLAGAEAAIGFVIAAKTIARFRLLDDRDFAEYYLLGTLASVSVAIVTALVARAALSG
jgi:hypothetical protein